jgi:hypothetical protein
MPEHSPVTSVSPLWLEINHRGHRGTQGKNGREIMPRPRLLLVVLALLSATVAAYPQNSSQHTEPAASSAQASRMPTPAEIAAAKASGKVWVNLSTGIYHRPGRWYGKTKNGKFVTAAEAKAAGYKPSKRQ